MVESLQSRVRRSDLPIAGPLGPVFTLVAWSETARRWVPLATSANRKIVEGLGIQLTAYRLVVCRVLEIAYDDCELIERTVESLKAGEMDPYIE